MHIEFVCKYVDNNRYEDWFDGYDYKGNTPDNEFDYYQVNPAYPSVIHDIKLTTRGGARLSDILPDFINKGIYVLDNTYKEENDAFNLFLFNDLTVWKTYIYNNYTSIYDNFDWDNLYIQTYGNQGDSLIVVLYDFPKPFIDLAKVFTIKGNDFTKLIIPPAARAPAPM